MAPAISLSLNDPKATGHMDLSPIYAGDGSRAESRFFASSSSVGSSTFQLSLRPSTTKMASRRGPVRHCEESRIYENAAALLRGGVSRMEAGVQMGPSLGSHSGGSQSGHSGSQLGGGPSEEELHVGRRSSHGGRSSDTGNQTLSSLEGRRSACLSPAAPPKLRQLPLQGTSAKGKGQPSARRSHSTSDEDSGWNSGSPTLREFSWVPSGLTPDQILQYFSQIPKEKIPYVGSTGDRWRTFQLTYQNPPQDADPRKCRYLSASETKALRALISQRKREALGKGTPRTVRPEQDGQRCRQCGEGLRAGELGVYTSKVRDAVWHPACFVCHACDELLVDLIYYAEGGTGRVFCGRHHAERSKPRCGHCDEMIFSEECTEAEGRSWHIPHFLCLHCDRELGGQRYVTRQGHAYCLCCYADVFGDLCGACRLPIDPDQPHLTHDRVFWHATERCYACDACQRPLLGQPSLPRHGRLFCSLDCYAQQTTAQTSPALASSRRLPPPLRLPGPASDSEENDYETVQSFRASPPMSPAEEAAVRLSQEAVARMSLSMHQEGPPTADRRRHSRRSPHSPSSKRSGRRHRSLSDLRASGSSQRSSQDEGAFGSTSSRRRPTVTFCASARDPAPSKPRSRRHRRPSRRRRGSSSDGRAPGSEAGSYAKATAQPPASPLYDDPYGYARSEHADCSTCSSDSSSDGDDDFLPAHYLPDVRRASALAHASPARRTRPQPPPPTPKRKPMKIRGSKLAALKQPTQGSQNCIVS